MQYDEVFGSKVFKDVFDRFGVLWSSAMRCEEISPPFQLPYFVLHLLHLTFVYSNVEPNIWSLECVFKLISSPYLELSLSRTNILVPWRFEIERFYCRSFTLEHLSIISSEWLTSFGSSLFPSWSSSPLQITKTVLEQIYILNNLMIFSFITSL